MIPNRVNGKRTFIQFYSPRERKKLRRSIVYIRLVVGTRLSQACHPCAGSFHYPPYPCDSVGAADEMTSGRPPGMGQHYPPSNDDLFSFSPQPVYYTGQRPPVSDDQLLQHFDINDADSIQQTARSSARPSISYDDFVGGRPAGPAPYDGPTRRTPDMLFPNSYSIRPDMTRQYSQSSDLQNYERYSDLDDFSSDYRSIGGYVSDVPLRDARHRDRNSILSLGGGIMGKAKNMLGMTPEYSEMDLPLTETRTQGAGTETLEQEESEPTKKKRFSRSNFKFGFGKKEVDPSTLGPRMIILNNPPANSLNKYVDNHVSTAKYNGFTFFPKFLFEQFSKYANLFFLFTAVLQQIPNISPTNRYTTIVPLIIVLIVSAIKELFEDYKRKVSDRGLNNSKVRVLRGSSFQQVKWTDVSVGDIVRVESEEPFPADLVLLASSEPEGLCYIETANLDGETNLKVKQAVPETATLVSPGDLSRLTGRIKSEQPNSSLYTYEATITMQSGGGDKELALAPDQLLLRGATLRNTPWVHGVIVFTGHETKLMRNATATPIKRTAVEQMVNKQILMLVAILLVLSLVSSVGDLAIRLKESAQLVYLDYKRFEPAKQFFSDIFTYWVLYSNLVPISLFVTMEIVKYYHALLINSDLDMYHAETDTPATCRTSALVEELGQIEYIFSDKTGTLTRNVMEFRQCSIAGIQYSEFVPEDRRAGAGVEMPIYDFNVLRQNRLTHPTRSEIHHFLTLLSTCHTVIPERPTDDPNDIKYQAASPDEGALVEGAVMLNYRFTNRRPRSVIISVEGQEEEYELLAVCEFNSTRKRMSTIFRCPDGKVRVYIKGADTVILERLHPHNPTVEVTLQHLEDYASEGLRTLCLGVREIPENEFREWWRAYDKANTTVSGSRQEELDKAAELIERDFTLLGATAIEDKLQEGVPDTIHTLQNAGVKIWVLTGDRQETAINIGMSCKLISEDMTLLIVNEETAEATRDNLTRKLQAVKNEATSADIDTLALIIDGRSLTFGLEKNMEKLFLDLAVMCKAVVCWYVVLNKLH